MMTRFMVEMELPEGAPASSVANRIRELVADDWSVEVAVRPASDIWKTLSNAMASDRLLHIEDDIKFEDEDRPGKYVVLMLLPNGHVEVLQSHLETPDPSSGVTEVFPTKRMAKEYIVKHPYLWEVGPTTKFMVLDVAAFDLFSPKEGSPR
jgi:hypothetical protein